MEKIQHCKNCGTSIDLETHNFCPDCGQKVGFRFWRLLKQEISQLLGRIFGKKALLFAFVFVAAFLLIFGSLFGFYKFKNFQKNRQAVEVVEEEKEVEVDWEIEKEVLSMVYAQGDQPLVELEAFSQEFAKLKVETWVDDLTKNEPKTVSIKPGSQHFSFQPEITPEGFDLLSDARNTFVNVKVTLIRDNDQEKELLNERKKVTFLSKNDIIWIQNGEKNFKYTLGLVDKDEDQIKQLVRKASDHVGEFGGEEDAMIGYLGDEKEVEAQLKAIFKAMADDYEINYVLSPFSYESSEAQKVKSPVEVIETKSGLCMELSLLIAAALENVGLNPVLVFVPGHVWVGVETAPHSEDFVFIESTALDKSASEAVKIAEENWEKLNEDGFGFYEMVRVSDQRQRGYLPFGS